MGFVLGLIGAFLGSSAAFGFGSAIGWFIGSTLGSLLSLEDTHESTASGRIVDFRGYNSKYGIPIARGYGVARFAGNLIWRSPVIETEDVETQCVKSGGFFGIGGSRKCVSNTSYQYNQSAAIAFCEGPAAAIKRIWGDGELMWEEGTTNVERIRSVTRFRDAENPYNPYNNRVIRPYLGTLTQRPDHLIKRYLGPAESESGLDEVYAFRSIVYIVVDSLDLETYGYRLPTFTAEVAFESNDDVVLRTLEEPSSGIQRMGVIAGHPNLYAGTDTGSRRGIWDIATQQILFQSSGNYPYSFDNSHAFENLSPQFFAMRHYFPFGNEHWTGPYDYITGRQLYWNRLTFYNFVGLQTGVYDPVRNAFWQISFLTAEMQYFPLYTEPLPTTRTRRSATSVYTAAPVTVANDLKALSFEGDESGVSAGMLFRSGRQFPEDWWMQSSTPGGISGRGTNIHMMKDGKVIWGTSSSGLYNCWIMISWLKDTNIYPRRAQQKAYRLKFNDGQNVVSLDQFVYIAADDSIVVDVGYSGYGTDPPQVDGQYKVYLSEFDDDNEEIRLPVAGTTGRHLNITAFSDNPAWQRGDVGGGVIAFHSNPYGLGDINNYTFLDCINMEVIRHDWFENLPSIFASTLYYPQLNASVARNKVIFWGGNNDTVLLADIVTDLMTRNDGDDLASMTSADIDVSELTDEVRGFPLVRQQTVRSAITQLMQGFFFDAVESDGIIKFRKRGRSTSFALPEDDLRATSYGTTKAQSSSLMYERRTEGELPRELVVRYPDIDNDYLANSQRARRVVTEADSNVTLSLDIVMNGDEAAQVADILLYDAWQEKNANFEFSISQKHIKVEPGDVGTITMNDGKTHRVRIVSANLGANGITECVAVEDFENSYISTATGVNSKIGDNTITNLFVMPILLDVTSRFVGESINAPAIVGGVTSLGDTFDGGKLYIRNADGGYNLAGIRGEGKAVTWASVDSEIGHPSNAIATNVFDTETVIEMSLVGGEMPISGTNEEALNGERLMLIDDEIVGYTTITIVDGRRFTVSNLLRGLYGTQHATYHRNGARVYFPENLFAAEIDPPEIDDQVSGYAQGLFGGQKTSGNVGYQANNVIPWAPTNMGYSGGSVTWDRMDRIYSDGIDPTEPTEIGEIAESYVIRHIDHNTEGEEGTILSEVESSATSTSAITVPSLPILLDIHQENDYGMSYPLRDVLSSDNNYSGVIDDFSTVTPVQRWGAAASYMTAFSDGPFLGQSIRFFPAGSGVDGWEVPTGACKDIEVLTRIYPSSYVRWTFGLNCGVYLRGSGASSSFSGAVVGLGSPWANLFGMDLYQRGKNTATGINPPYDASIYYDFSPTPEYPTYYYGRGFWLRVRAYGNRFQGRIWEIGETEPTSWQLDAYDDSFGPYFGSCGLFTLSGSIASDYFSWAHRGGTAA